MGKITVKHYLNKKLKPITFDEEKFYPVYIRIIYNQFSTEKKSESDIWMTEKSYEYHTKNNHPLKNELPDNSLNHILKKSIEKEISCIYHGIKLLEKQNLKVDRKSLLYIVDKWSLEVTRFLMETYFFNLFVYIQNGNIDEYNYNTDYEEFIYLFKDENILDAINKVYKYTGVDLRSYLKEETILDMESLKIIAKISEAQTERLKFNSTYLSFSEFACMDYKDKIKSLLGNCTINYYDKIINTIDKLIAKGIEHTYRLKSAYT